jgi:hypothetical protein|tara:strand:- start:1533 stop:2117 length:585 start_codon:yes stop_codon:yes gene_type:complete
MNNSRNNDIHTPESIHLENNFSENIIARDRTRSEEPWSTEGEHLMKDWMKQIFNLQSRHDEAGYYYKKMRKIWGLPCILIPSIMAPVTNVYSKWKFIQYINMGAFVLVAIFTGVDSFFSFALRRERHFTQSTRYGELHSEMQIELIKERRYRMQTDVFFTRIQMKYDMLNANAPVFPTHLKDKTYDYPYSSSEP